MNGGARPFHYRYSIGIEAVHGGDSSLANELEALGGPIEPEPPWNAGGPFVWQRRTNKTTLVGWARAISMREAGRSGAWEAWGVDISDPAMLQRWPFAWDELRREPSPESLAKLVSRLNSDPTGGLPPFKGGEAAALHRTYLAFLEGGGRTVHVPLDQPSDVSILPFLWLFGPQPPEQATLMTPRIGAPTVHPSPTYAPRIDLGQPEESFVNPQLSEIVQYAANRKYKKALEAANRLRTMPPAQLLAQLRGSAQRDEYEEEMAMAVEPNRPSPADRKSLWRNPTSVRVPMPVDRILLGATLIASLIAVTLTARLQPLRSALTATTTDSTATTETSATDTTATAPATDTTATDTAAQQAPAWADSVLDALGRSSARKSTDIQTLIDATPRPPSWTKAEQMKIRFAGWQLYLQHAKYLGATAPLDARPGDAFFTAIGRARGEELDKVLNSDEELGKWAATYSPR